jgi:hypothetical protein
VIKVGVPKGLLLLHSSYLRESEVPDDLKSFTLDEKFHVHELYLNVFEVDSSTSLFVLLQPAWL